MKKILNSIKNKIVLLLDISLVKKLVLLYILVIAIPFIVFGLYALSNFESANKFQIIKNAEDDLQNEKNNIENKIELCERTAQIIISNGRFIDFIGSDKEISTEDFIRFNKEDLNYIQRIQYANPDIYKLRLFINNPNIYEMHPTIFDEIRIADKKWLTEIKASNVKSYWDLNHIDNNVISTLNPSYKNVASFYREILYPGNQHLGILEINMLEEVFFQSIYNKDNQKSDSFTCLVEGNNILLNSENSFFKSIDINSTNLTKLITEGTKGKKGNFDIKINKQNVMVIYSHIDSISSTIYKVVSMESMIRYINRIRYLIISAILVAISVLSAFTYFLTSIILKKMRIIIDSMRKVQEGDFRVSVQVRGNDEFGELAHHFRKMLRKINELIGIIVRKESASKDAEIRALQTQINAHFIYNVLENIKMIALIEEQYEISNALTSLGRMIRYSINWKKQYVYLNDEIEHIKNYITLINIRYDNEVVLNLNIPEEYLEQEILKMILQPIVENAVNYGLKDNEEGGSLEINAAIEENRLIIDIIDNGIGMDEQQLSKVINSIYYNGEASSSSNKGNGIGLKNVNERIKLFYGKDYGIYIYSQKVKGTKVRVIIPYNEYRVGGQE